MDRPTKPNFLIFITDQMRADHMGCAGNPAIRTPNLDRLAAEGVHLPRAYLNNPVCMPSRATLYTGRTPRGHGVRCNGIPLDRSIPTVPEVLRQAGYATASVGKIHLSSYQLHRDLPREQFPPQRHPEVAEYWREGKIDHVPTPYYGLEHVDLTIGHAGGVQGDWRNWLRREHPEAAAAMANPQAHKRPANGAEGCSTLPIPEELHHTAWCAQRSIDYLNRHDGQRPFFLICSFPDPHHSYAVPQGWDELYGPEDVVPPVAREGEFDDLPWFMRARYETDIKTSGRVKASRMSDLHRRQILAHTYAMVSLIDKHVGRVLDTLRERGLEENTVVVFLSDHGDLMGDHGLLNKGPFHFEGLLRVPMIWRWPGQFRAHSTAASAGLASLLDFAPTLLDLAGVSIPEGPASPEAPQQPPAWPGRSLVPLLRGETDTVQQSVVVEFDEDYLGLRLRTLITDRHKLTTYTGHRGPEPFGELFDLENDPHELHNLWDRPEHAALRQALTAQLHHRLVETDSALPRRIAHA